jgi:hypothetical protein
VGVQTLHVSWVVQCYKFSIGHGLYNTTNSPWVMGCTTPVGVQTLHVSWVVQRYKVSMGHGLYNTTKSPWVMDCTILLGVQILHGSWVVQPYNFPMGHWLTFIIDHGCVYFYQATLYNYFHCTNMLMSTLYLELFHPCNLCKLHPSYFCPLIPSFSFSCSISSMPWLLTPHFFKSYLPEYPHIPKGSNYPFHLFCHNFSFFTPPFCSCSCSQPIDPIDCILSVVHQL